MKKNRSRISAKYILFILVLLCVLLIALSSQGLLPRQVRDLAGYVITPAQKGITSVLQWTEDRFSFFRDKKSLIDENRELKEKVAQLEEQNRDLQAANDQTAQLRELYDLDREYDSYPKVAANVIGRDSSWFETFIIDKGIADGIQADMNVLAGGALVGKVIQAEETWSQVRSVTDDASNVSAMNAETGDYCVVTGEGSRSHTTLTFSQMTDSDGNSKVGDRLVTSNISDVYLPGLLLGYITELHADEDNVTSSGALSVSGDFEHLQNVMVITTLKE